MNIGRAKGIVYNFAFILFVLKINSLEDIIKYYKAKMSKLLSRETTVDYKHISKRETSIFISDHTVPLKGKKLAYKTLFDLAMLLMVV